MKVRIRLQAPADCLVGASLRLDGRRHGALTGVQTEFEVERGWHLLEVRDSAHPTRPLRFQVHPSRDVDVDVRAAQQQHLDYAWFELVPA